MNQTRGESGVRHDVESAIQAFTGVLEELQVSHRALEERAQRVEAELCQANAELASKVTELDEVNRHLEAILSSLPTGVVVRDAHGAVVRVNEAAADILGVDADDLIGADTWPGLAGESANGEPQPLVRDDGSRHVLASLYSPMQCADGEDLGSVEIIDDRTELTRMTERAQRLDKMAALGTMAGGIAHEIRNPMNAIRGFATLLERRMEAGSKESRWSHLIKSGVDEADAIIASMLTFAEPERLRLEEVHLVTIVEEAVSAVRRSLEHEGRESDYEITTYVEEALLRADRIKLRQSIRNLVANALDAQPTGGAVEVEATSVADEILIHVRDAGPGIPIEWIGRVADPFFTTRSDGTGLGLALVHTIAGLHGGALDIRRGPCELGGAEVTLRIPQSVPIPSKSVNPTSKSVHWPATDRATNR
ncbi:MAG: PAS domain S-box protein [bacterium]|nr:PAS domain S-box protein [bacterium]